MKVTLDIPDDDIRAALQTFRGLIDGGYWATDMRPRAPTKTIGADVYERATGWRRLDIERGLRMMLTGDGAFRTHNLKCWGPVECDAFVQYAAFGKLVYK